MLRWTVVFLVIALIAGGFGFWRLEGTAMWTDRGHRICRKCQRRNDASAVKRSYRAALPRGAWLMETPATRASVE